MTHENMEKEQATWNQKKHLSSSMITRLEQEQERQTMKRCKQFQTNKLSNVNPPSQLSQYITNDREAQQWEGVFNVH